MKKETIISILLIALGFVFEYFYLMAENTFFDVKFYISGILCIIAGLIGLWIYAIMPFINKRLGDEDPTD